MQKNINHEINSHVFKKTNQKEYAIFAMFLNRKGAREAIRSLKNHGFHTDDIKLLTSVKNGNRDFVYHQDTNLKIGMLSGAIAGAVLLGIVGIIIGMDKRFNLGINSWILRATLGVFVGLICGAVTGALVGIGIPKAAVRRYKFYLKEGGHVVMVHLKSEEESREGYYILENTGGQDITILEESQIWSALVPETKKLTFH